jgi:hypothetical protein
MTSRRTWLAAVIAVLVPLTALAATAQAAPKGIFSVFAQCPTEIPSNALCQYAQTTSGEFSIGTTKVPINKTITLQGGAISSGKLNEFYLLPAKNGESISKTELNVPGGLLDIVNCEEIKGSGLFEGIARALCKSIFENKTTGVTATTELVANEKDPAILNQANLFFEEGAALTLPVRVHLKNPLLGNSCYIGSESNPVLLHLTTGTTSPPAPNKPIKGAKGKFSEEEEKELSVTNISENSLVDNSYSAPKAEGCGEFFSFIIDPIVNSKLSLPSASGHNTAILSGTLKIAESSAVKASEKF